MNLCICTCAVEVQNGQISSKRGGEDDKWSPWTPRYAPGMSVWLSHSLNKCVDSLYCKCDISTYVLPDPTPPSPCHTHIHTHTHSQYQINISETYSSLSLYSGWDYTEFTALAHVPLRPPNDYSTLSDIISSGQTIDGAHLNILAIVKQVGSCIGHAECSV